MERKYAKFFIGLVHELIQDNGQREKLFDALRLYQSGRDLSRLLCDMQEVLDEPAKLDLYDYLRPLVLLHHQVAYSQRLPSTPGVKARIVRLHRRAGEGLGFAIRGGLEHRVGIFVSDVKPESQADQQGLQVGDEILSVNGFSIDEAIHEDVLNLIKAKDDIVLKVINVGMLPMKEDPAADIKWKYVVDAKRESEEEMMKRPRDLKIFIDSSGHQSLGCGIVSGPPQSPGIFVEKVRPGSVAEEVNLEPGDLIVDVNGTAFQRITHKEAVLALVSSRQLNITIRKGVGLQWMEWTPNLRTQSSGSGATSQSSQQLENDAAQDIPANQETPRESTSTQGWMQQHPRSSQDVEIKGAGLSLALSADVERREILLGKFATTPTDTSFSDRENSLPSPTSPLSGAAAMMEQRRLQPSALPQLLGPGDDDFRFSDTVSNKFCDMFRPVELEGRALHCLTYNKKLDLGVGVEGGLGSPLGQKVVVAVLEEGGVAHKSGKMRVGDQLMAVNGIRLVGVTASKAEDILRNAGSNSHQEDVELLFCASYLVNEEESLTYF